MYIEATDSSQVGMDPSHCDIRWQQDSLLHIFSSSLLSSVLLHTHLSAAGVDSGWKGIKCSGGGTQMLTSGLGLGFIAWFCPSFLLVMNMTLL